ncbi:MAG TPA: TIM barrel protein [Bryobacteraceae bacterium]|jgi:sugar phosphate isomerase/epimerase|nr:TIM barrel protein [Bryobacteraceae bacterium]
MNISRRDFGQILLAGLPVALAEAAETNGVTLGVMTYSYRALPVPAGAERVDGQSEALKANNARDIEFYEAEAQPPGRADGLEKWRAATQLDHFKSARRKLEAAGIKTHAVTVNYRDILTDDDLDRTFEQAKALGTNVIAASTQVSMAKRLAPFAEKHKIYVAFHGHSNTKDPNEFATPESFDAALAASKYFRINLDIGHFSAAGYDPVDYIQKHHDKITHLHVKDRKKNDGPNMPWGEGDTPIRQVLLLLKAKKYPLPALVEYEYRGAGTPVEEVGKCLNYMRKAVG